MTVKALKRKQGRPIGSKKQVPPGVAEDIGNLQTPAQVRDLIQRLANHTMRGEISTLQCSALNGLLHTWCKIYEMCDIQVKLDRMEKQINKHISKGGKFIL